jgi:rod shape-determining protein MreD
VGVVAAELMRWIPFAIFAYVTLGLQTGMARALDWHGAGPNLVLVAMVFIGLNAPREPALLGALALGFMQDLASQQAMGLYALGFGLAGLLVISLRRTLFREHLLTHFLATFFAGLIVGGVLALHARVRPEGGREPVMWMTLFYTAVYSGLLAPVVMWPLQRARKVFGFQGSAPRRFPMPRPGR